MWKDKDENLYPFSYILEGRYASADEYPHDEELDWDKVLIRHTRLIIQLEKCQ